MSNPASKAEELGIVMVKSFATKNFRLQSGEVLLELKLAYEI
jgi:hypothetical protein